MVNPNLRKAPACYNQTRVCAFCSQLFDQQQDSYRPSWEAKEAEKERIRKEEENARRKVINDPLSQMEKERVEGIVNEQRLRSDVKQHSGYSPSACAFEKDSCKLLSPSSTPKTPPRRQKKISSRHKQSVTKKLRFQDADKLNN